MMLDEFKAAIRDKRMVRVKFNSKEKGIITRKCIPTDYGPSRIAKDKTDRYHFLDLESSHGFHPLPVFPGQIISLDVLDEHFEPETYFKGKKIIWLFSRDWGKYS